MIKKWLTWVNALVAGVGILLLLLGFAFLYLRPTTIPVSEEPPPKTALPKRIFAQPKEAYENIGEPLLSLQFAPMSMQLPDLKRYMIYYGKNGRPDAVAERSLLHFAFTGNKNISSLLPGERLYVIYDRSLKPPQYTFSVNNSPTNLWIEATAEGAEAHVKASMRGETGEVINEPESNGNFNLPEKEFVRMGGTPWEIGKNRVDATLLARQKARWYGPDLFLARHGGKEYAAQVGKQRIDFGDADESYSIFVASNDSLVWENERWNAVKPGPQSLGKPLLVVKKIDDRLMSLELWDPEGKGKVLLNLLRSTDVAPSVNIAQQFKFVGARTRTQFTFEINKERVLLSPKDWLLSTKAGWVKLVTPQEIDDYVERRTLGPLFVFDEVERQGDKQVLKGTLFNASRTDLQSVEIPLKQTALQGKAAPGKAGDKGAKPKSKPPLNIPFPDGRRESMPFPRPPTQEETEDMEEDDEAVPAEEDEDFPDDFRDDNEGEEDDEEFWRDF